MGNLTTEEMYSLLTPDNQALIDKIIQGFQDNKNTPENVLLQIIASPETPPAQRRGAEMLLSAFHSGVHADG